MDLIPWLDLDSKNNTIEKVGIYMKEKRELHKPISAYLEFNLVWVQAFIAQGIFLLPPFFMG